MKRIKVPEPPGGDPLINVMQLEDLSKKLGEIIERLERIESRQISTTAMVKEVTTEVQPRGSFASSELPPSRD